MPNIQQRLTASEIEGLLRADQKAHLTDALKQVVWRNDVKATKALFARGASPFVLTDGDLAMADMKTPFSLSRLIDLLPGPTVRAVKRERRKWLKAAAVTAEAG